MITKFDVGQRVLWNYWGYKKAPIEGLIQWIEIDRDNDIIYHIEHPHPYFGGVAWSSCQEEDIIRCLNQGNPYR